MRVIGLGALSLRSLVSRVVRLGVIAGCLQPTLLLEARAGRILRLGWWSRYRIWIWQSRLVPAGSV